MLPTPDDVYRRGLDVFGGAVGKLSAGDWRRSSPCAGWTALDVLGHVGAATRFGLALLAGEQPAWQPAERPADEVQGDPRDWWRSVSADAAGALADVALDKEVEGPSGRRTIGAGLSFPAIDLFVHTWDLSRTVGEEVTIPDDVIAFGHSVLDPIPDGQLRSPTTFGPSQSVSSGSTPTDVFVAWTGRDPSWTPPTS